MRKNFILTLLPILILASVQLSNAQQTKKATIGILTLASDDPLAKVLREGLRDLGYVDNDRVKVYEGRFSPGEKSPQMSKRPDRIEFAMTDGHMRHYHADGKVEEVK